jgi:vacuolar-type H+-ATPase subunit I/STV1
MNSTSALREIADTWSRTYSEMKQLESALTALISEHYTEKEKYDELLRQRDELKEALRKICYHENTINIADKMRVIAKAAIKSAESNNQ